MSDENKKNTQENEKSEQEVSPETEESQQEGGDNVTELKPDLKEELAKAKNDYLYLYAEFENYKKKVAQERSQLIKYANENVLRDLLQIMDNFRLAIKMEVTQENVQSFVDGVNMIAKELDNMLERFHVSKIPAEGKTFDPNLHEAIGTEINEEMDNGKVCRVHKEGYKLHDRLLRPAQVVISSDKEE